MAAVHLSSRQQHHSRRRSSSDPFVDPSPQKKYSNPPPPPPKPVQSPRMPKPTFDIADAVRDTVTVRAQPDVTGRRVKTSVV